MSVMSVARMVRAPRRIFTDERGFSLIEVIAALFIFTLLTLGLVPLLTSSIRGSNTARADTIGKNATLKGMERARGLPFYVSYATSPTKVDLLDLFYPDAATDIVVNGRTMYRTVCSSAPAALANPACPRDVPDGYTLTFDAEFVDPVASGVQPTPGETATSYANVAPSATYAWNSASTDTPPRQILQMTITTTWTVGANDQSYTITSLLSDRSFGGRKIKATASLGYGIDIYTAYDSNSGGGTRLSSGNVFAPASESDIEGRRLSTARQTTTAIRGELQQEAGGSLGTAVGATSNVLQAPPDQEPGTITAAAGSLRHPEFGNAAVASYGPTSVISPAALTGSAAPSAVGDAEVTGLVPGGSEYVAIRNPQLTVQDYNELLLSATAPLVSVVRVNGLPGPLPGIIAPDPTGRTVVGGTRTSTLPTAVSAQATTGIDRTLMFDTSGWPELSDTESVAGGGTLTGFGHLIVIDDFQAVVTCDSDSDGTGSGEARYRGTLYYWEDPVVNGDRDDGRYRAVTFDVTSSTAGSDPLAAVMAENMSAGEGNGPLVYDHASANQRIYLFGKTLGRTVGAGGGPRGGERLAYLRNWNSVTTSSSRVESSTDAAGAAVATVNSSVDGAIEIETADLDVDRRNSTALTVSIGSLSCYAEDAR